MKKFCIIIPFHNSWNWHTDYTNQTALLLSRRHTVICYLWGDAVSLREIIIDKKPFVPVTKNGNMWRYHPLFIIPGKRIVSIQYINMFLNCVAVYLLSIGIAIRKNQRLLFWFFGIFDPVFLLLPLFFRRTQTVYDCVDVPAHPNPKIQLLLEQSESRLLSYAWIVTANSKTMQSRLKSIRKDTRLVPLGFRNEMFDTKTAYHMQLDRRHPVIEYIGAIDYRIDLSLLEHLVSRHSRWQFVIVGPVFHDHLSVKEQARMRILLSKSNVRHAHVANRYIPDILSKCDVTIIPYRSDSIFNQYAFPMKTMEYLYAQKRIIAAEGIRELRRFYPLVLFASNPKEWEQYLEHAIAHPLSLAQKILARNTALSHTWEKKIRALCRLIETS